MIVLGCRCWPARVEGNSHGLVPVLPVCRFGPVADDIDQQFAEGRGDRRGFAAEQDRDPVWAGNDLLAAHRGDTNQRLGVEQ